MDILKKMYIGMLVILLAACGGSEQENARQAPIQNQPTPATTPAAPNVATTPATPPPTAEPAQNAEGIWHYTCPNGHTGGAGSATACAECGTTLVHNSVYHGNPAAAPAAAAGGAVAPVAGGTPATMFADPSKTPINTTVGAAPVAAPTAEPAQNATGVWHYTCPSGCAGGGGSATACSSCGATLAHNQAYHQ